MGSEVYVHFGSGGRPVRGEDVAAAIGEEAIEATEEQTKGKGSLFVARVGRTSQAREGEQVELLVDHAPAPLLRPGDRARDLRRRGRDRLGRNPGEAGDDLLAVGLERLLLALGHQVDVELVDADRLELLQLGDGVLGACRARRSGRRSRP